MQVIYTPAAICCLIAVVLSLLTGIVLLTFSPHTNDNKANYYLGAAFLCFGFTFTVIYLIYTRLILFFPHLYRLGHLSWLLYTVLSYLYVRTSVKQQPLKWADLIHLLPALLYLVDYSPFIFSSAAYKVQHIKADLDNLDLSNSFRQSWLFPAGFHVPARTLLAVFYWILQIRILRSIDKTVKQQNPIWFRWQYIYNLLQILLFGPTVIFIITGQSSVWSTTIPPALGVLLSTITLYLYPQILYGVQEKIIEQLYKPPSLPPSPPPAQSPPASIRQKPALDETFISLISESLNKLMKENRPFLNSNYSLKELAADLGIPTHQASAFINQATGKNFNDYLNHKRIEYCLDFIKEGKAENLNMHGISQQCGFNNRNTFANAFKKFTGKLPSEYLTGSVSDSLQ